MATKKTTRKDLRLFDLGNGLYRDIQDLPREEDYPKLLPVGGALYHIVFVDKIKGAVGQCSGTAKLILISRDQDQLEALCTFFHEVMHAWDNEHGFNLGHPLIRKLEYAIVDALIHFPRRQGACAKCGEK